MKTQKGKQIKTLRQLIKVVLRRGSVYHPMYRGHDFVPAIRVLNLCGTALLAQLSAGILYEYIPKRERKQKNEEFAYYKNESFVSLLKNVRKIL